MSVPGDTWGRTVRSPGFKFFLVGALVLLICIPLGIVWLLLSERQARAVEVQNKIAADWGQAQRLHGPYLIVPYTVSVRITDAQRTTESIQERRAVFLPDSFRVKGDVKTEVRRRSIYDVTVYRSSLMLEGSFAVPDISAVEAEPVSIRWQDAIVALGINDVSGLKETVDLRVDGGPTLPFEPSIGLPVSTSNGIHARIGPLVEAAMKQNPQAAGKASSIPAFAFRIGLALNGSSSLKIAPVGRQTFVDLSSDWPHPSFGGGFLPMERTIAGNGFKAQWTVPHLARSVPQSFADLGGYQTSLDRFTGYDMGVDFFVPIDFYSLVDRAAKYGFMFLAVAFGAVFIMEVMSGKRVHAVQYIFVGLAMVIFYVLLLSLAEHTGFTAAYIAASAATGGIISLYVGKALQQARRGILMLGIFSLLYGLLYMILRLEDYALLTGAIAGFLLLTATMFATLRIDWSGENSKPYA
jgi:inner membrane protein